MFLKKLYLHRIFLILIILLIFLNIKIITIVDEIYNCKSTMKDVIKIDEQKSILNYSRSTNYINYIRDKIRNTNLNPIIKNKYYIHDSIKNDNNGKQSSKLLVILVQVHSRLNYLKELIDSLKQTKHINETLVIFSHDLYDDEMNKLIENITFCSTLQIFYPLSLQLYPDTFPGQDPNDCPKSIKKEEALKLKCSNAAHPDTFGNYRESKVVQIKHHWIWKLSFVFEKLNETKNLENLHVLLLEEDYYLMPDSIHVLRKLSEK